MSLTAEAHAVYRAALSIADDIDRSGRFRAVLHILRCSGGKHLPEILASRVEQVDLTAESLKDADGAKDIAGGSLVIGGDRVALDEEAAREVARYLKRRRSYTRKRMYRRDRGDGVWYVQVFCAGARACVSLQTTNKKKARSRLRAARRRARRRALSRDAGWLFPSFAPAEDTVGVGQVRLWINQAVGRQADADVRAKCKRPRPSYRSSLRRRKD